MDLALVTFAVETMISFLAKVHGQSVLRHEFPIPENARRQCQDRPWLTFVGALRYMSLPSPQWTAQLIAA
jgi:hypothetical protein